MRGTESEGVVIAAGERGSEAITTTVGDPYTSASLFYLCAGPGPAVERVHHGGGLALTLNAAAMSRASSASTVSFHAQPIQHLCLSELDSTTAA